MTKTKTVNSITFLDGRTFKVGDRVRFATKYCSDGVGIVTGIRVPRRGVAKVLVAPTSFEQRGDMDYYPLKDGGHFCRISTHGLVGGELLTDDDA